jgi:hypothetical protein
MKLTPPQKTAAVFAHKAAASLIERCGSAENASGILRQLTAKPTTQYNKI